MQLVVRLFTVFGFLVFTQSHVQAQNKTNTNTVVATTPTTKPTAPSPIDARVTILVNGVRIQLDYVNCDAYYNALLYGNGGNKDITDAQFKRRDCQQATVVFNFPTCAKEWAEKNKTNPAVLEAMTTELEQMGQAAFCKKYIGMTTVAPSAPAPAMLKKQ